MKRFCTLFLVLCLLWTAFPALAEFPVMTLAPLPGYTLRPAAQEVMVFATMSMKGNIVGYIIPGGQQEVHVLSVSGEWCYISFTTVNGVSYGYVPLSCFEVVPKATPTPTPGLSFPVGTPAWVCNSAEGYRVNLRTEPSATATSLGKFYTGTSLVLTGEVQNGFAQVLLADTLLGWLDARFLTTNAQSFVPEMPLVTIDNPGSGGSLRAGPATSANRLGWYVHGTPVTVLGVRSDGWCLVIIEGTVGYMSEGLLSGAFPYDHGTDSDHPALNGTMVSGENQLYINTRTAGGQLNLRKDANASSKSLGLFYTGTPVTVISYTRIGWIYVRIGQTTGYVDADYLTDTMPTRYGVQRIIRNSRADGLNLRDMPSTGGKILDFFPNYTAVTLLGELRDGWCYVDCGGTLGYMLGSSLIAPN